MAQIERCDPMGLAVDGRLQYQLIVRFGSARTPPEVERNRDGDFCKAIQYLHDISGGCVSGRKPFRAQEYSLIFNK